MSMLSDDEQDELLQWEDRKRVASSTTDRITRGVVKALQEIELGKNIDEMLSMLRAADYARLLGIIEESYRTTKKIDKQLVQQLKAEMRALSARSSTFASNVEIE